MIAQPIRPEVEPLKHPFGSEEPGGDVVVAGDAEVPAGGWLAHVPPQSRYTQSPEPILEQSKVTVALSVVEQMPQPHLRLSARSSGVPSVSKTKQVEHCLTLVRPVGHPEKTMKKS